MSAAAGPPDYEEPVFGQRLLGRLADTVLMVPVVAVVGLLVDGRGGAVLALAAITASEVGMVSVGGRTVGKVLLGTRIVDARTGAPPIPLQAVLRWAVLAAGAVVALLVPALDAIQAGWVLLVVLPVLRGPLHQGVHDRVARTVVVADVIEEEIAI